MKKKILTLSVLIIIILSIFITFYSLYNLRNVGIKSAIHNANSISEVVKSGLTSHMVNNNMDDVDTFIRSVSNIRNIEKLWLVRSEKINQQFNTTSFNIPRDKIDEEVLRTGEIKYEVDEGLTTSKIRISIPYIAQPDKGIDCLKCHNVSQGETLGAVSMELDISSIKEIGIESLYLTLFVVMLTVLIFTFISKKVLSPYTFLLTLFKDNLNYALNGNFKKIEPPFGLSEDIRNLTNDYNNLMITFKDTTEEIDKKLQGFIGYRTEFLTNRNPLSESREIIKKLSNLYQFKKEVEQDSSKEEIYKRLADVMENEFELRNFTFSEIDMLNNKITKVIEKGESFYCYKTLCESPELCRSARTKSDVHSIDLHNSCQYFDEKDKYYYCFNINIVKSLYLIVHCVVDTEEEFEQLKQKTVFIKNYLKEATPSLEVNLLMNALKNSAFRDGLTGLYNRKFLDEHSKKLIPQVKRESLNIGVLMLDMDHFKAVNDEYGHDIGDKVLKELGSILEESVRESDLVIRYGGEEFIVLLVGVKDAESALKIANNIGKKVRENEIDVYAGAKLKKTISIGLSMFPQDGKNFDSVLKNADIALYEAKSSGRDKVVRFKEEQVSSVDLF
ncbi:GGDEF domain-containing protein [Arcobacter arenosus]|jgi:diguanylate cyclase (GGDEF)-like protein|uniref:GGDEF domain-containing protein n=1 Tax=Arcobacter arenosus TaxID=2576037 RepID=UPI003BABE767